MNNASHLVLLPNWKRAKCILLTGSIVEKEKDYFKNDVSQNVKQAAIEGFPR